MSDSSSVIPEYTFPSPIPDRNKRTGLEAILDQCMHLFRIISFFHDMEVRSSDPVALFGEFFSVRDIVDRMPGDHQTGDNLLISVDRNRSFQEAFSRFTGSPGIVVAGVGAGKPG